MLSGEERPQMEEDFRKRKKRAHPIIHQRKQDV